MGRTVQLKIGDFIGEKFDLQAGVPQGSILSPSLFIFYTSDLPQPINENCRDVLFADDITQVVEYRGDDKEELPIRTEQEIVRINNFEKLWKIQTNRNKFKMISVSKSHPAPIAVDDNNLYFTIDVNILGLTMSRTGCKKHVTAKINFAKAQLLKLRRFYKLRPGVNCSSVSRPGETNSGVSSGTHGSHFKNQYGYNASAAESGTEDGSKWDTRPAQNYKGTARAVQRRNNKFKTLQQITEIMEQNRRTSS